MEERKLKEKKPRSKVCRPNLDYKYTLPIRHEFLDCRHYINGVKDIDGRQVMRPLTDEEKDWLDKFYQGDLHASFNDDNKDLFEMTEDEKVRCVELESQLKEVRATIKATHKNFTNTEILKELYEQRDVLREEIHRLDKAKGSYHRNYVRNKDLFGLMKTQFSSKLIPLDDFIKLEDTEDEF